MTTSIIARVNNVDIMSTRDEQLVPVRPICEALGIDFASQTVKIKNHYLLAPTAGPAQWLELMENSEKCSVCLWNIFSDGY